MRHEARVAAIIVGEFIGSQALAHGANWLFEKFAVSKPIEAPSFELGLLLFAVAMTATSVFAFLGARGGSDSHNGSNDDGWS